MDHRQAMGADVSPTHFQLMGLALDHARAAMAHHDVPVGAVVAKAGQVIAVGRNRRQVDGDPTAHAEIIALRAAAAALGTWHLEGCEIVVTLEPCAMCAGAVVLSRIDRLVYGAEDPKAGAVRSLMRIADDDRLNHRAEIVTGIRAEECGRVLTDFFAERRALAKARRADRA